MIVLEDVAEDTNAGQKEIARLEAENQALKGELSKYLPKEREPVRTSGKEPYVTTDKTAYRLGDTVHVTGYVEWPSEDSFPVNLGGYVDYPKSLDYKLSIDNTLTGHEEYLSWCSASSYEADKIRPGDTFEWNFGSQIGGIGLADLPCPIGMDGKIDFSFEITEDFHLGEYKMRSEFTPSSLPDTPYLSPVKFNVIP